MQESKMNKCQKGGGSNKKEEIGSLCPVGASFVLKILDQTFTGPPFLPPPPPRPLLTKISKPPPFLVLFKLLIIP